MNKINSLYHNTPNLPHKIKKIIGNYSYELTSRIGQGYSSQVYKGHNENTSQEVAIKVTASLLSPRSST